MRALVLPAFLAGWLAWTYLLAHYGEPQAVWLWRDVFGVLSW